MGSQIRSQNMQPTGVKEGKPPIQKPLCRLCECPTSDGHVLASQVDRFKLRKWAMKVLELTATDENLPMLIGEDHLICYFCIWKAEFDDEGGDDSVAWWPKNLDLEENAKVLRDNFSAGEVVQCWVQLEEIELPEYEKEIPKKRKPGNKHCIYCGIDYKNLMDHVKLRHSEAIKCGFFGCTTYFHTEEEKEQHMQQDIYAKHFTRRESRKILCKFCTEITFLSTLDIWRTHMTRFHPEFSVRCLHFGCEEYFKSKSELIVHINSWHKRGLNQDHLQCKHCEYYTTNHKNLRRHEQLMHKPKIFKCDTCDAKFGSKWILNTHCKLRHTFEKCESCGQDVTLGAIAVHRKPSVCSKCKLSFECSGLYKLHKKTRCLETIHRCAVCTQVYATAWRLKFHASRVHVTKATKAIRIEIFRCHHCDYSTSTKKNLQLHIQLTHFPQRLKCEICNTSFASEYFLELHEQNLHEYVHCSECRQEMLRHDVINHQKIKSCRRCKCKFRCSRSYQLHWESCKQTPFTCKECAESFPSNWKLNRHVKKVHTKTEVFVFCAHCDYSTLRKSRFLEHLKRRHFPKTIKCRKCNTYYASKHFLKRHNNSFHEFVHCAECAQEVGRHAMYGHRTVKTCRRCKCKFKCSGLLEEHKKSCQKK
ncbi:zinc finger protein 431-like [Cloeon dipterum]|uniref:zinc finger protein 431-like n=1 Tax=Cloeon dipterum TaxID=197152 RepID=UPI00321F67D3